MINTVLLRECLIPSNNTVIKVNGCSTDFCIPLVRGWEQTFLKLSLNVCFNFSLSVFSSHVGPGYGISSLCKTNPATSLEGYQFTVTVHILPRHGLVLGQS